MFLFYIFPSFPLWFQYTNIRWRGRVCGKIYGGHFNKSRQHPLPHSPKHVQHVE